MAKHTHLLAIDLGDVLLRVDHDLAYRRLERICAYRAAQIAQRLDNHALIHALDRGDLSPDEFAQQLCTELRGAFNTETLRDAWSGILSVRQDVVDWLCEILPVASVVLVSNTNWWHWAEAQRLLPVLSHFDACFVSFRERVRKPEAAFYSRVRARWSQPNALFIDDRRENCDAAGHHGFTAWHFNDLPPLARFVQDWVRSS